MRRGPLGPHWGGGHLCCPHRAPGPIASFWSRQGTRSRAGTLGTQFRRGPGNAGRAAAAAKEEGPLECGEGGCGRNKGGVPWNARREAEAAEALTRVVRQKSSIRISYSV